MSEVNKEQTLKQLSDNWNDEDDLLVILLKNSIELLENDGNHLVIMNYLSKNWGNRNDLLVTLLKACITLSKDGENNHLYVMNHLAENWKQRDAVVRATQKAYRKHGLGKWEKVGRNTIDLVIDTFTKPAELILSVADATTESLSKRLMDD